MKGDRRELTLPLPQPVLPPRPPLDAAAQTFLDDALDRVLRAWAEGRELPLEALAAARPDLREELAVLLARAREAALLHPPVLPEVPGYEILHELGRGGMGVVWAARQVGLDRLVALKVLPSGASDSERARRRFLAEARGLAKVQHPHVVGIYDVLEAGELCAYAMERIDGKSLADVLDELAGWTRRGPAPRVEFGGPGSTALPRDPVVWFCHLGIAIARALAAVHARGLVHRDVKPSNILLRADGTPLLSDFGVVRDEHAELTRSGQIVGTPLFAPPEQLAGRHEAVGPRSDVFALGATLHLALAGAPAFAGSNAAELAASIEARARRPLTALGLPRDLDTIVGKCLEARPEDRYPSAAAVADDLERLLALRPIAARPLGLGPRTMRMLARNRRAVAVAAVSGAWVLVATVLLAWWLWQRAEAPKRFELHLREAQRKLLDPWLSERIARDRVGERLPLDSAAARAAEAIASYDRALQCLPERGDVRREREVVAYAQIAAAAARANGGRAAVALPPDLARDPRLRGLFAFVVGDTRGCERDWQTLASVPGSPDPLVDAALGQMYLQAGMPGKAYARLVLALAAWAADGALAIATAESALLVHDSAQAGRYLKVAEGAGVEEEWFARVRAEWLAVTGRGDEAETLYERVAWSTDLAAQNQARVRYARFLMTRERHERALELLFDLVERAPNGPEYVPALWECACAWWSHLPRESRAMELLQAWNNPGWPRLTRLANARARWTRDSPESSTAIGALASPAGHRHHGSMVTLPLELIVKTVWPNALARRVPLGVQSTVGHMLAADMETLPGPSLSRATKDRHSPFWAIALLTIVSAVTPTRAQIQWSDHTIASGPMSAWTSGGSAYLESTRELVLYGGVDATRQSVMSDTWTWNGSRWRQLVPGTGPGPRAHTALVPEGASSLLLFGGQTAIGSQTTQDTWRWNGLSWAQISPAVSPGPRSAHAMALDAHRGVVVLFGGSDAVNSDNRDDTWEWSPSGTWTQLTPTISPPKRAEHRLAYDPIRRRVVLFGGSRGPQHAWTMLNDTWEWNGTNWLGHTPTRAPSPRSGFGLVWDEERAVVVLFGGLSASNQFFNDVWEWNGSNWTQRTPEPGPQPAGRYHPAFAYDTHQRRTVLFGGTIPTFATAADTWILEPITHAEFSPTGPGCAGPLGTPTLAAVPASLPWTGDRFTAEITGIPNIFPVPVLLLGFANPAVPGLFCRADCTLRVQPDLAFALAPIGGRATWSVPIPDDRNLLGFNQLYTQVVVFNFGTSCVDSMSNGMQMTIGAR